MKKTLTAALTTALVVGAASTTFAAANPFSDVPADHWAYDAVAQLADDGVIEGYGDGTYRGQNEITRYEMAQMVAKAMAKEDQVNAQQKAMIDRLAAEFSEELNNLGVRVANLEDRVDNVKWTGKLQYEYTRTKTDGEDAKTKTNNLKFRLEPTATVNDHWKVKARLDANWNPEKDQGKYNKKTGFTDNNVKLARAYVAGHYGITDINAGLIPYYSEQGVVFDENLSGASVTVGEGQKFSGTVIAGRKSDDTDTVHNLQGLNLSVNPTKEFHAAAEYYRASRVSDSDYDHIWGLGAQYKFADTAALSAGYWKNTSENNGDKNKAWNVELAYRGAEPENMHSFGLFVAYRRLGESVALQPTFDAIDAGQKGWELGGDYTFAKNVVGTLKYFNGRNLEGDTKAHAYYGSLEYFF